MITTPILHDLIISRDILEEVLSYVSVQNNFFTPRYPNTLFDQSVLSHIAYVENKKLGFHNLSLNIKKAGFRGRWVNYTALDPWFDYYKMGVLPLFYNYINLTEILQLMPTRSVLKVSQNNLIDIARIIQFFETTRYIEAFYLNREVSFGDYKSFMIIITPAELLLYDLNYQLLGKIDFINSKVTYIGLQKLGFQSFFTYIKSLTYKFTKLLPEVNYFRKKSWLEIRKPVSAISENKVKAPWKWLRSQEVANKSFLQDFSFLKKSYMKKYGLDANNVEQFNSFQFQVIKITNPFWLKWGTRVILPKKNIQRKDKHNTSTALKILQNKKYDLDTNKLFSLFQEGASLMTEINQKVHTWKKDLSSTKPRPDRFWNLGEWSTEAELTYTDVDNYEGNREEDRSTELPAIMDILVPFINNPGWRTQTEYTKITRAEVGQIPEQSSKEFYKVLDMYAHLKNNPYKSRFIVRDKYESLYGLSPVDRFHLQQIRTKINKLESQINAFNANEQWAVDLWYPCERDDAVKKLKSLKKYEVSALNLIGDGFISPIVKVFKTLILSENLSPAQKFYYMFKFQYKYWLKLKELITIRKKFQPNLSNYMLLHPQEQHQIKLINFLVGFMLRSTDPSILSMAIGKQVVGQQTRFKKKFWKLMIDQTYKGITLDMNLTFNALEKHLDSSISLSKKEFNSLGDFLFVNARGTHSSNLERINDNAQFFEFNNSQQTFLRYYFQFKHLLKDLFIENYSYKNGKTYIQLVPIYYDAWDNPVWKTHKTKFQPDVPMFFGTVLNFLRSIKADYESRFEVFSQNYPLLDSELNNKTALTTTWRKFKHKFFDMDAAVHRKATKKKKMKRWLRKRENRNRFTKFYNLLNIKGLYPHKWKKFRKISWALLAQLKSNPIMTGDHNNIRGRDYEMIETDKEFYLAHLFKYDNELDMEDPGYTNSCNKDVIFPSTKEAIKPFLKSVFEPKYLKYMRDGDMSLNLKQYEKALEFAKINAQRRFDYYLIDANRYIEDIGIKHMFKLANPKFVPSWLNTHEFKDILISLSENSNSANKLHLLKLLKKIYPSNYVSILFNSILKQSQFKKTHDSLVKAYGSGKLGEFLLTRGTEQKPFGLNLNFLYNKTTDQLFTLTSLLEDTLLEQDRFNDDITKNPLTSNFNSILLNPQLLHMALSESRSLTALGDFDPFWEANISNESGDLILEEFDQNVHDPQKLTYYVLQKNSIDHILEQHPTFFSHMEYPLNFQFSKYLFSLSNTSKNLEVQDYQIKRNDLILKGFPGLENLLHSPNSWWTGIPNGYLYYPKLMLNPTNFVFKDRDCFSFMLGDSLHWKRLILERIKVVRYFRWLRFKNEQKINVTKDNSIPYGKQEEVSLDELSQDIDDLDITQEDISLNELSQDIDDLEIIQEEDTESYLIEHKKKFSLCTKELIDDAKEKEKLKRFRLSVKVLEILNADQKEMDDLAGHHYSWVKTCRYTLVDPAKLRAYSLCNLNNEDIFPRSVRRKLTMFLKAHILIQQTYFFETKLKSIQKRLGMLSIKANRYENYIENLYNRIKNETPLERFQRITENAVLPKKVYVVEDHESEPIYLDTTTVIDKVIKGEIPMVESSILNKETTINLLVQNSDYIEYQWDCIEDIQRQLKFWNTKLNKIDVTKLLTKGDFRTRLVFVLEDINRLLVNQSISISNNKKLKQWLFTYLAGTVNMTLVGKMKEMYEDALENVSDL